MYCEMSARCSCVCVVCSYMFAHTNAIANCMEPYRSQVQYEVTGLQDVDRGKN